MVVASAASGVAIILVRRQPRWRSSPRKGISPEVPIVALRASQGAQNARLRGLLDTRTSRDHLSAPNAPRQGYRVICGRHGEPLPTGKGNAIRQQGHC